LVLEGRREMRYQGFPWFVVAVWKEFEGRLFREEAIGCDAEICKNLSQVLVERIVF